MHNHFHAVASGWRLFAVAAMSALVIAVPASASAATTLYNLSYKGDFAYAYFSSVNGCDEVFASVFANNGASTESVTHHTSSSTAVVVAGTYDQCSGLRGVYYYGQVDLSRGQFTVSQKQAALNATVPVTDIDTQVTSNLAVNLTWTATGGSSTGRSMYRQTFPDGSRSISRTAGTNTPASASGTVSDGSVNFTPYPSYIAQIGSSSGGTLQTIR